MRAAQTCLLLFAATLGAAGCDAILGVTDVPAAPAAGGGGATPGGPYNQIDDLTKWTTFDTSMVDPDAKGAAGAAFDGRYVYFVPLRVLSNTTGYTLVRYDTHGTFSDKASWSVFKLNTVSDAAKDFLGTVFDGRFVYLVPDQNADATVVRYDTTATFSLASSWSLFGPTVVDPNARGLQGGTFDGRYLYFAPTAWSDVLRYDTKSAFTSAPSWTSFDVSTVSPLLQPADGGVGQEHFDNGAVFDGENVYFWPQHGSVVQQYDRGTFAFSSSWGVFDTTKLAPDAKAFTPGAFDGRYAYACPNGPDDATATHAWAVQYDTHGSFTLATFWTAFDTETVDPNARGFNEAAFDGRYIYCVPGDTTTLVRYDTTATFSNASSWTAFDTKKATGTAEGFWGAVFDGRYLYMASWEDGTVARFDARDPTQTTSLPSNYGSFF